MNSELFEGITINKKNQSIKLGFNREKTDENGNVIKRKPSSINELWDLQKILCQEVVNYWGGQQNIDMIYAKRTNVYNNKLERDSSGRVYRTKPDGKKIYSDFTLKTPMFKLGNKKIPNYTMVINMTNAIDCPSSNHCPVGGPNGACYAASEERIFNNYLSANTRNYFVFLAASRNYRIRELLFEVIEKYIEVFNEYLAKKTDSERAEKGFPDKVLSVRLNEVGDFFSRRAVDMIDELSGRLKDKFGINVYSYTASSGYPVGRNPDGSVKTGGYDFSNVKNFSVNASWSTMKGKAVKRSFIALPEKDFYECCPELTPVTVKNGIGIPQVKYSEKLHSFYYRCPCGRPKEELGVESCKDCCVCASSFGSEYGIVSYNVYIVAHSANKDKLAKNPNMAYIKNQNNGNNDNNSDSADNNNDFSV